MTSSPKGSALIRSGSSGVDALHPADRHTNRGFDPGRSQPGGSSEVTTLDRADQSLSVTAKEPPRILVVDAALALQDSHVLLLRSIPAIVEIVSSYFDMYLHEEHGYALVILALHSESRETAEAAHFVRRRWSAARILLLQDASATIDDWLYDERIDPRLHPAAVRETAIRLMTDYKYCISA
jgi:hypothetical protein